MSAANRPEITLRNAIAEDALCIGVLGMQVFLDTYATQGIRRSIANEALQAFAPQTIAELMAQPDISLVVAESDGHLVGFAQVKLTASHSMIEASDVAELQRLYIQERFTGLGIGYQLLQAAEQRAKLGGASLLWATVWVGNARALGFYPRRGYALLGAPTYTFQGETHGNRLFGKALMPDA
ncbi:MULTISPECIES: GNAT family N-acetyltransferase [Pseudomonas]|jgi:GNAT superfamily N-acetyltransferase|uniref:GNAT family N-acetyltransferase n=1 Tax=Pseudomonas TaxID=286 RepID=UPI00084A3AC4|nr:MULTISPECIES: GNAT family N-acetyltransferase [Pseudomonas]MEA3168775.1 diamine N-acetyltransferase [Pseudomonas sp.]OEC72830.1 acetyltransferase [Pseudomonas sp. AP19]OPB03326.1 GNAT family N-acetyltransferase [Pseudomonas fluorescens]